MDEWMSIAEINMSYLVLKRIFNHTGSRMLFSLPVMQPGGILRKGGYNDSAFMVDAHSGHTWGILEFSA